MVQGVSVDGRKQRLTAANLFDKSNIMGKRAGRPAVAASQRREAYFRFVVTKAEARKIRAKAKELGLSISEYLRSMAVPPKE